MYLSGNTCKFILCALYLDTKYSFRNNPLHLPLNFICEGINIFDIHAVIGFDWIKLTLVLDGLLDSDL